MRLATVVASALLMAGNVANAQTVITKAATLDELELAGSWLGGVAPGSSDIAFWDSTVTSDYTSAWFNEDLSWLGLRITDPAGSIKIDSGNTLTLGAGGIDMSTAAQNLTLNANLHLGAAQTWNVNAGRTLAITGMISGATGFTKLGTGIVQLSNANIYEGETIVSAGTLAISHGSALGTKAGGTVVDGGVLSLSGGITVNGEALTIRGDNGPLQSSGNNRWTGNITAKTQTVTAQAVTTRITVNSGTLTLDGDIFMTGEGGTATGIFVIGGNGNAIVNGVISGLDSTSTFYRSSTGTGTVFLNNANTFTGASQISNGFFQLGHRNALQFSSLNLNSANGLKFGPGIGTFTLGGLGGGTFTPTGGSAQTVALSLTEAGGTTPITLEVGNNNANATYNGTLAGNGTLVKIGTGTQTLTAASPDFSGAVNIKTGTLNISGDDRLGNGAVSIEAGATLGASASFTLTRPFTFTGAGAGLGANSGITMTVESLIGGNFGLTKRGAGAVTLTNNSNNFTGDVRVLAGTLYISDVAQLGNPSNNIILDGGTLGTAANFTLTRPATIASAGGGFSAGSGATFIVESLIQGTAGLTKAGAGTVLLANDANNFTGNIRIIGGALSFTKDSQLGNPANAIEFAGGVLSRFAENFTSSRDLIFTATGTANLFQVAPDKTVEFTGTLSGNGTLRVDEGNNSNAIFPNRLMIFSGSGSNGTGNTVVSSNAVLSLRGATTLGTGNLNIQGNSVLELTDQVGDMTRPFGTGAGQIQLDTSVGAGFSARGTSKIVAIGGIGTETAFIWSGTPQFLRTNANLVFGSATANATVDFRNALDLNNTGTGVTRRILTVNGEAPGVKEAVFSGLINKTGSGSVTLEIAGNGEVELTNGNNGMGGTAWTTIVKGGTLLLGANATSGAGNTVLSPATGAIQLGDTVAVTANGFNGAAALLTNGAFDVSRNVTVNAGNVSTATFGGNADAKTTWSGTITLNKDAQITSASTGANKVLVSGSITGIGKLTKIGGGIAELSRAAGNSYTGGTAIDAGTLLVSNTSGSATGTGAVVVGSEGTLGGSGFIDGAVTVNGTLAPGVLNVANTIDFGASARFALEITGATPGAGGYDQLKMSNAASAVSLTSGASINLSLSGFTPTGSEVFFVLTREDAGSFSTLFAGTNEGGLVSLGGGFFGQVTYLANWDNLAPGNSSLTGGNDIAIYNVVPEPGTVTTLLGGFAALLGLQRFRRRAV